MQAFNADVQDRIPALVKSILEQNAIATELTPESLLVDFGLTLMACQSDARCGSRVRFHHPTS
jgi:hypothetical protein